MRTRSVVIQRLHHSISDATRAWSLQQVPSSLWVYLLRYGIPHMLTLDQKVEARERLADLDFTGMYLYWLYRDNSEDFSPLLRIWRALGTEHAESLYKKTIENVRISHPDSLILLRNVVEFFRDAGWLKSAAQVAKSAVTEHQRLLGAKADQTLMSLNQYALAEKAIGNYHVAIEAAQEALAGLRISLGSENPELYVNINSLASLLNAARRYEEAKPLFEEAIANRTRLLGANHHKTLISVATLSWMLIKMKRYEEARPLCETVYEKRTEILGAKHPKTLNSANILGWLCTLQGEYDSACSFLDTAIEGRIEQLGADHPKTLDSQMGYATTLFWKGDIKQAESLFLKTIPAQEKALGMNHPTTIESIWDYIQLLEKSDRLSQAVTSSISLLDRCKQTPQKKHSLQRTIALSVSRWLWSLNERDRALDQDAAFLDDPQTNSPVLMLEHGERLCTSQNPRGVTWLRQAMPLLMDTDQHRCQNLLVKFEALLPNDAPD